MQNATISHDDQILITGAGGFIGPRVIEGLIARGYRNILCFSRPSGNADRIKALREKHRDARIEIFTGNLLSKEDCRKATGNAKLIYHLAAGRGEKSIPDAFMNSVVTTRNLLEAANQSGVLRRFVSVSSFSVYDPERASGKVLDETCPMEEQPQLRGDAYSFAKVKQDEIVMEYGRKFSIPYVIVRPGFVYGPGNEGITGRVGLGTFGIFLHLGGSNRIPFTYVDNCADAIVLAGLKPGVEGEAFNVVDDDLPTSRQFLKLYKKNVRRFPSLYLPRFASYFLCFLWEKYSAWSQGQLPPTFNRKAWHAYWKKIRYTNAKLKSRLEWTPKIPSRDAFLIYFDSCRKKQRNV